MKRILATLAAAALVLTACCNDGTKSTKLERVCDSGVDTEHFGDIIYDIMAAGGVNELHSIMVLKDGKVIYEDYDYAHNADCLHVMWSASKTFTATAVGFAVQDGLLNVDDKVADYFSPEELGEDPEGYFEKLTIKDLLMMASGLKEDPIAEAGSKALLKPAEYTLKGGWEFEPGTRFRYNSMNTYLCGVIVTKVTGKRLSDYLNEKLFKPLGIREYKWAQSAEGYDFGGWGLFLSVENFAKMGQFFLQKGVWEGKRILNEEWFDEATKAQIWQNGVGVINDDEGQQGYCYQMWRCTHDSYRLDGAWGQFCIVIPEKNAVVAIHEHVNNSFATIKAVWKNIYPYL